MKFLDPWAMFQYMGGNFTIHLVMGLFAAREYYFFYTSVSTQVNDFDDCVQKCQVLQSNDTLY